MTHGTRAGRAVLFAALCAAACIPATAAADTFRVTKKADGGPGSPRHAVDRANANPGPDRIVIARKRGKLLNVSLTVCGPDDSEEDANADGDLDHTDAAGLAIKANGARISNTCTGERIIDAVSGSGGLTITGAQLTGGEALSDGGAIESIDQPLTIASSQLVGNQAASDGGAIDTSSSEIVIRNSVLRGNSGGGNGGAVRASAGSVELISSRVAGNDAGGDGGGLRGSSTAFTVRRSTIAGNDAGGDGGGIRTASGVIEFVASTVSGNTAAGDGGGLHNSGSDPITIANSTFSGNEAGEDGGVLRTAAAPVTLRNATLFENRAAGLGDGIYNVTAATTIARSILTSPGDNCSTSTGSFDSQGYNVVSDESCDATGPGDLDDRRPGLLPLRNNGGPTKTHALRRGSAARDMSPAGQAPARDQRGAPRDRRGDSGAYERVICQGVVVNRVGTNGRDRIRGTRKDDGILGLGGNDRLFGLKGNDGICGGAGRDRLSGGAGNDGLDGGPGRDTCDGGSGNDSARRCEAESNIP